MLKKEYKLDKRNTEGIQNYMSEWRRISGLKERDTFKYIIRKEYASEEIYYMEIITNRPGYLIGPGGNRIREFSNKLKAENISRIDILDTYRIHTVFPKKEEE